MRSVSIAELVSIVAERDTAVVLPSLKHALYWWPKIQDYIEERFEQVKRTKTSVVIFPTRTVLRLWVPYERDPTMPMDWGHNRRGFEFVDFYGMYGREL